MKIPYFWKGKRDFQLDEVLDILHLSVDGNRICLERPLGVNEDASFVIDTRKLQARRDYLEDNIGGYRNQGHCGKIFTVKNDRIVDAYAMERTLQERPPLGPDQYLVKVVYWSHKKHKDFKRRTFEVSSSRGEGVFVLVQYLFEAEAHEVSPCKKMRTSEGTKEKIRDRVGSHKTPSALYDELFDEVGGMDFKCASDLPRSIDQIKYERQKLRKKTDVDEMATLLQMSKEGQYICNLQWTPSPRMVVLTENVVQDVVDFCTDPETFTPFTIDTTFNVGPFYVTTTTYKHLKLVDQRSGKNPSLPGPALFHVKQDTGQFLYFAQTLQERNRNVGDILAIGSDRFKGYANGFATVCPVARVIVCKKHAEDDVDRKLSSLGITGARNKFKKDIFGSEASKEKVHTADGARDIEEFSDPLSDGNMITFPPSEKWKVVFVKDTKMRKCYGCGGTVRATSDFDPPSLWNIVLTKKEYRVYTPRGQDSIKISTKKENVYYHPRIKCLRLKNPDVSGNSVEVPSELESQLDDLHKSQLKKEFGLKL